MKRMQQGEGQGKDATLYKAVREGLMEATYEQRPEDQTTQNLGEACPMQRE